MYALGVLKSQIISVPIILNPLDLVDKVSQLRFLANQISADELLPMFSP